MSLLTAAWARWYITQVKLIENAMRTRPWHTRSPNTLRAGCADADAGSAALDCELLRECCTDCDCDCALEADEPAPAPAPAPLGPSTLTLSPLALLPPLPPLAPLAPVEELPAPTPTSVRCAALYRDTGAVERGFFAPECAEARMLFTKLPSMTDA
jgi:hypothetical protein